MVKKQLRALITRPILDSRPLAEKLTEKGYKVTVEPMLEIKFRDESINELEKALKKSPQAILATSANGIRALSKLSKRRDFNIITVGDATRHIALKLGFNNTKSAGGDVTGMYRYVMRNLKPVDGNIVHLSGSQIAGDIKTMLEREGFSVKRIILYDAEPVEKFSKKLKKELKEDEIDVALFFSTRTLRTFIEIAEKEGLINHFAKIKAFCLSKRIADEATKMKWAKIHTAKLPTSASLLSLID